MDVRKSIETPALSFNKGWRPPVHHPFLQSFYHSLYVKKQNGICVAGII
jgi:hypothetical protein